jgi:hypothetical protein
MKKGLAGEAGIIESVFYAKRNQMDQGPAAGAPGAASVTRIRRLCCWP